MPQCSKCKQEKLPEEFPKSSRARNGLNSQCRECFRQFPRTSQEARTSKLKTYYGLSDFEYQNLYNEQSGCCAICHKAFEILCVDHDHKTGQIRGLLCRECNLLIGHFERPNFKEAIFYLQKQRPFDLSRTLLMLGRR